jgi:spore germination protein YaaH
LSFVYNITASSAHLVWFSDAKAMADKIKLAKNMKLKGAFFFKLDGENDPAMWEKIK